MSDNTPPYNSRVAVQRFGKFASLRLTQSDLNRNGIALAEARSWDWGDRPPLDDEGHRPDAVYLYGDPRKILKVLQRLQEVYAKVVAIKDARENGRSVAVSRRFVTRSIVIPEEKKKKGRKK